MKTLLNPWFIAGCLLWLVTLIMRRLGHPLPFINGYAGDAAVIPVIASLTLCFMRMFMIKSYSYVLSARQVVFIVAYTSIVFEALLPALSKTYTRDWADVLLYALGGAFFYTVMNRPVVRKVKFSL